MFPWLARVYDRDATSRKESQDTSNSVDTSNDSLSNVGKEVKGRTHTFYQVLIDTRDAPYIVSLSYNLSSNILNYVFYRTQPSI